MECVPRAGSDAPDKAYTQHRDDATGVEQLRLFESGLGEKTKGSKQPAVHRGVEPRPGQGAV